MPNFSVALAKMDWQFSPYIAPLLLAMIVNDAVAIYMWRRRSVGGAAPLALLIFAVACWSFGYALQLSLVDVEAMRASNCINYIFISAAPPLWVVFTLQFAGREPRRRALYLLFLLEPLFVQVLVWSNEQHRLFFAEEKLVVADGHQYLYGEYGPLFWIHAIYCYALMGWGAVVLCREVLDSRHALFRRQIISLLCGLLLPWAVNALYIFGFSERYLDWTPLAFTATGWGAAWALVRLRLVDVLPVARDAIIAGMGEGVVALDLRRRVAFMNEAAQHIFSRADGVIGRPLFEALPELRGQLLPYGIGDCGETEIALARGETRRIYVLRQSSLYGHSRVLTGYLLVLHDITERKEAERVLREMKEVAESASLAKSEFLANMSHELRTPLNAILGYAQILVGDASLPEKHRQYVDTIGRSGGHLLRLINDVLDLSKIEAGREEIAETSFALSALIEDLADIFSMRCRQQGLSWQLQMEPADVVVRGDEQKLRQVLINLLGNAIKFCGRGQVGLCVEQCGEDRYRFAVSDTGPGIASESIAALFEPFQQGEEGGRHGGTGLGLAIARRHVELMGGSLRAESNAPAGTRFSFELSLARSGEAAKIEKRWKCVERLAVAASVRALIVDDVQTNIDVLAEMLERIGAQVETANSGARALEMARDRDFDIAFIDIRMPGMDGHEVRRQLVARRPSLKVVATTASVFAHQRRAYMEEGFDAFLDKPVRAERIYACVDKVLDVQFEMAEPEPVAGEIEIPDFAIPLALRNNLELAVRKHSITELDLCFAELEQLGGRDLAGYLRSLSRRFDMDSLQRALDENARL